MADLDETELKKLTVAQLKDLLKEKDLPITGKKAELIERLLEAPAGGAEKAKSPEAAAKPAASSTASPVAAKPTTTTAATAAAKSPPAAGAATATSPTAAGASAEDKKAAREAKFGTGDKVAARAARFGIPLKGTPAADGLAKSAVAKGNGGAKAGKAAAPAADLTPEAIEKLKKRAEKFGTVATASPVLKQVLTAEQQAAEAERIAKRKSKFGIVDVPAVDERKKARMEKFGTAPKGGGGGGKGAAKTVAPVRELTAEEKAKIEARKARFN